MKPHSSVPTVSSRPLVDALIVNDELDLLEHRLRLLGDHVDHFVIAESRSTYAGAIKPLHVAENLHRFAAWQHKLTLVEYDLSSQPDDRWARESASRESLLAPLRRIAPDGVAMLCDVDEIPSVEQCEAARSVDRVMAIPMTTYYRRANWRLERDTPLLTSKVFPVAQVSGPLHPIRWRRDTDQHQVRGERGGHFSYIGFNQHQLAEKYAAFSHEEFDFPAASSPLLLRVADWAKVDHLGVPSADGGLLTLEPQPRWSRLQRELHGLRPDWFDLADRPPPEPLRRAAGVWITDVVQLRDRQASLLMEHPRSVMTARGGMTAAGILRRGLGGWRRARQLQRGSAQPGQMP